MPTRGPRICSCGSVVKSGEMCACAKRRRAQADADRASASARGYDRGWRRVRGAFLKANPVCCVAGCGQPATEADHIQSVRERPDLRLVWSNLRPMCRPHHSQRTARDQGFARRTPVGPASAPALRGEGRNFDQRGVDRPVNSARESEELGFSRGADE